MKEDRQLRERCLHFANVTSRDSILVNERIWTVFGNTNPKNKFYFVERHTHFFNSGGWVLLMVILGDFLMVKHSARYVVNTKTFLNVLAPTVFCPAVVLVAVGT